MSYVEDETFEKIDFVQSPLKKATYEGCKFVNCNFANADLSNFGFSECSFLDCNFSSAKIINTSFQNVFFKDCKLLGLEFDKCSDFLFTVNFEGCSLNFSSFYKQKLKKTKFQNCTLHEVDFTETDLTGSVFDDCDLQRAIFEKSIVEKVDFSTAFNYIIDPELNKIKKAKFSKDGILGLLTRFDIEVI